MKISKLIFTFLIVIAMVQFCVGQEKPQAVLVDEWKQIYCENNLSRLDHFINELQDDPGSTGYVVIYYGEKSLQERYMNENVMVEHFKFRKFDATRIKTVSVNRGDEHAELKFWRVPKGAALSAEKTEEFASPTTAVIFGTPGELCDTFSPSLYKTYLDKHPNLSGRVVLYGESMRDARKNGKYWLDRLKENSIPRNRFKVVYSTARPNPAAEFWLVPVKKK